MHIFALDQVKSRLERRAAGGKVLRDEEKGKGEGGKEQASTDWQDDNDHAYITAATNQRHGEALRLVFFDEWAGVLVQGRNNQFYLVSVSPLSNKRDGTRDDS